MKLKLTVLTLLVAGLLMTSSFAFAAGPDSLFVSQTAVNNATYSMVQTNAFNGVPMLKLKIVNTYAAQRDISSIIVSMAGATTAFDDNDFSLDVLEDTNANGVLDLDDTLLTDAPVNATGAAAGDITIALDTLIEIAAGDSAYAIVTVNNAAGAAADKIEIIWDYEVTDALMTDLLTGGADLANGAIDAGDIANVPDLSILATGVEDIVLAEAGTPIPVGDTPNMAQGVPVVAFKVDTDATFSHVLDTITLKDGTWTGDVADADTAYLYLDVAGADDPLVGHVIFSALNEVFDLSAFDNEIVIDTDMGAPVFVAQGVTLSFYVTLDLAGTGGEFDGTTEDIAVDIDATLSTADGGIAFDAVGVEPDVEGNLITMIPLAVTLESMDLGGPPFGRANGLIDAIKLTFTADGDPINIDDDEVDILNFTAVDGGGAAGYTEAFSSVYSGDVTDNDVIYIKFTDEHNTVVGASDDVPALTYSGATIIIDEDGLYGLPAFGPEDATDAAPPVPLNVVTNDSDGDGYLNYVAVHFSEPLAAADEAGFEITGYEIASSALGQVGVTADLIGLTAGAAFGDADEVLILNLVKAEDFDTDATPDYTFSDVEGTIAGVTPGVSTNNVALAVGSFNNLNVPVNDVAAPKLARVTTLDEDSDGKFDMLKLWFSEPVQLNSNVTPTLTAADLTDNNGVVGNGFDFGDDHTGTYDFTDTGNTGLGTSILMFPVNEVGSLDTAVQPGLLFDNSSEDILTDMASSPNLFPPYTFIMVADSSLIIDEGDVWLEDGISPQITAAVTLDGSATVAGVQNGKLDAIRLTFSEAMGTDISTYEDLLIDGEAIVDSAVVSGSIVVVRLEEDEYNTGVQPLVTYSGDSIEDASGAALGAISKTAVDNAKPLIVKAVTADMGYAGQTAYNGLIDGMAIMFSEPINLVKLDDQFDADDGINDEFYFSTAGYAVADTVEIVDDQNMIIYITESGNPDLDTEIVPELRYVVIADSNIVDMNGYTLANITADGTTIATGMVETDGAAPVVILATTVDDDNDGFIDGVALTFNETPEIDEDDSLMVLAAVTMEEVDNEIDLSEASYSIDGDILTIVGVSDGVGSEGWDTDALPEVDIADDNGITDAAGNVVAAVEEYATEDGAVPVIGKAIAQKDTKNIVVTFSEPVTNDAVGDLDAADFAYINVADTVAANANGIDDVTGTAPNAVVTLTTDLTLTDDMVSMDLLAVKDGAVVDIALNEAFVDSVNISDIEIPELDSAVTVDANNDGQIDNIMLTFTEEIRDANLSGYLAANDTLVIVPAIGPSKWTVEGFTVIGINKTISDAAAATASDNLDKDIYNVDDTPNDEVLYLALVQNPPHEFTGPGDTDVAPMLSMVGGAVGGPFASGVSDYTPNFVASITDFEVEDAVGPVIISAEMPDQTTLRVTFSEEPQDDPKAKDVFIWAVGTEEVDYIAEGWILNVSKVDLNPKILVFEMKLGTNVPAGMESTIEYAAIDKLEDMEENGNVLSEDPVDVDPPPADEPTAVEDLPDAFALSKNFPNPFNPTTTIEYAIPADGAGHVELVIYNINGQKVRTLVSETKEAGYYNVVWDGRNDYGEMSSSGLYLFRIVSGSFSKVERMTFMK
ncbi:FlgD immunoglobulin-like domain containing protein [Candidatus Latescibacterota bacterium]